MASPLRLLHRLAVPVVAWLVVSLGLTLVGQASGAIERDHVARVNRGGVQRANRLGTDGSHGVDLVDIDAPAPVHAGGGTGGDDHRPAVAGRRTVTPARAALAPPGLAAAAVTVPAPPGAFVWLVPTAPLLVALQPLALSGGERAPPSL